MLHSLCEVFSRDLFIFWLFFGLIFCNYSCLFFFRAVYVIFLADISCLPLSLEFVGRPLYEDNVLQQNILPHSGPNNNLRGCSWAHVHTIQGGDGPCGPSLLPPQGPDVHLPKNLNLLSRRRSCKGCDWSAL